MVFAAPLIFLYLVIKNREEVEDEESKFVQVYGTLTEDLNTKNLFCLLWKVTALIKQMLTCLILLYLYETPIIQIMLLLLMQIFSEVSLIWAKPNDAPIDN